jgi:hypothetical protein
MGIAWTGLTGPTIDGTQVSKTTTTYAGIVIGNGGIAGPGGTGGGKGTSNAGPDGATASKGDANAIEQFQ